jgi:hypothetical protein
MDPTLDWHESTLAGFTGLFLMRYQSAASYFVVNGTAIGGQLANGYGEAYTLPGHGDCDTHSDPTKDLLHSVNKLAFNIGAVAARENASYLEPRIDAGLSIYTMVTGYVQGDHNIFHTNFHWFAAAAAVEAFCIALILPTYFGFWRLGRRVAFSPLETAKMCFAFETSAR